MDIKRTDEKLIKDIEEWNNQLKCISNVDRAEREKYLEQRCEELENKITNLQEENEKLKQPQIFIDTMDMEERYGQELYEDYLKEQLEDYKSRNKKALDNCKKSIESINKKLENNKEPFEVVDGRIVCLNDYQICRLKAIRMKCKELLNILQGEDKDE